MQIRYSQKLLGILAGLLVLFGSSLLIFLVDPGSLSAAELLTNSDFEDGANGWTTSPGTTIFTIVSSPVYSGNLAASVGSTSSATKAIVQNVAGIVAGNRYTLSGYGYKDDPNVVLVRLRVAWYTTDDCSGSQLATADSNELTADTPDFVFLTTGALTAPENVRCAQVRAQIQPVGSDPATAYFDELRFVVDEEPPPPPITPITGGIFNEIAWGGTIASSSDEWLELQNVTTQTINLAGWVITSTGGLSIDLNGVIDPGGYFLLERTDDETISDIAADQIYTGGLGNDGDRLFLSNGQVIIDSANLDGGPWPGGSAAPDYISMERIDPTLPDADNNWAGNNLRHRNGLDAAGNPVNGTPRQPNSTTYPPPPVVPLLISELLYDGVTPSTEGDEFAEICNPTAETADLTGYKIGDEETEGAGEGMYRLPDQASLPPAACLVIAKNAAQFAARFGYLPDFEVLVNGDGHIDTPTVPNLSKYSAWGSGSWALTNHSDEFLILGPDNQLLDAVAYRDGAYDALALLPAASAAEPYSLQRVWPFDTDWMAADFYRDIPSPGYLTPLPGDTDPPSPAPVLADGMHAYFGSLRTESTFAEGDAPPTYLFAQARHAGFHFLGLADPGQALSQAAWEATLTWAINSTLPGEFVALSGVTWQADEAGHISIFDLNEPIHSAHPETETLAGLYTYLADRPAAIAQFDAPAPGDFAEFAYDTRAARQFFLQETADPLTGNSLDLSPLYQSWGQGWRVAPTFNAVLGAPGWGVDVAARTGIVAPALTREDLLTAIRARRLFATADANFALTLRANDIWMGSELPEPGPLTLAISTLDPDAESATLTLYDRTIPLTETIVTSPYTWRVSLTSRTGHFYWVQARQADGDWAVTAPIWIAGEAALETIWLNEFLPDPDDTDWNGDGTADSEDEWVELFNPTGAPVSLAGWTLSDDSGRTHRFPEQALISPYGYYLLHRATSRIALNNSGDSLTLYRPNGSIADTLTYDDNPGDGISICRRRETGEWWTRCLPSPEGANIILPPERPLELSIYDAKRVTEGAWVRVHGSVTVPPGVFGKNVMYIQDSTHGIRIKLPSKHGLFFALGDRLEVTGYLDLFRGEWEIDIKDPGEVDRLEEPRLVPPLPINSGLLSKGYEGLLVQLEVMPIAFVRRRTHFWVDDGTGPAYVYIYSPSRIKRRGLTLDAPMTIVGIVNRRLEEGSEVGGYRISPRYQFDIIQYVPPVPPVPDDWPGLLPETGQ